MCHFLIAFNNEFCLNIFKRKIYFTWKSMPRESMPHTFTPHNFLFLFMKKKIGFPVVVFLQLLMLFPLPLFHSFLFISYVDFFFFLLRSISPFSMLMADDPPSWFLLSTIFIELLPEITKRKKKKKITKKLFEKKNKRNQSSKEIIDTIRAHHHSFIFFGN